MLAELTELTVLFVPWELIFKAHHEKSIIDLSFTSIFSLICIVNKLSRWMTWKIFSIDFKNLCKFHSIQEQQSGWRWGWGSGTCLNGLSLKMAWKIEKNTKNDLLKIFTTFFYHLLCVVCHAAYLYVSMS